MVRKGEKAKKKLYGDKVSKMGGGGGEGGDGSLRRDDRDGQNRRLHLARLPQARQLRESRAVAIHRLVGVRIPFPKCRVHLAGARRRAAAVDDGDVDETRNKQDVEAHLDE